MKKLFYSEGAVFLVPLRTGGYARGVIARSSPTANGLLFGYFFGPRLTSTDTVALHDLDPGKAILRVMFGGLGLMNGAWPMKGVVPNWDRSKWPMPDFARRPPGMKARLVRYADDDPNRVEAEYPIEDSSGMPTDALSGYGAVEIKLTKLLK